MSTIPSLPGDPVPPHSPKAVALQDEVAKLCKTTSLRFPGAQPVSFGTQDLLKLESQDYWVCEKSDGIRVLLLVFLHPVDGQLVFLIDRHNTYRELSGLFFPHYENPMMPLRNTIVDGELVLDSDRASGTSILRFLAFDCLVVDNENVMERPLDKRYGRLKEWFYKPYRRMLVDHPHVASQQPFEVQVKEIRLSYHVEQVFNVDIPSLQHGNDGLIYTCVNTPYTSGTDPNIMKWKPPSENSIDFKLVLRFPPLQTNPNKPDFHARPVFLLQVWCGGDGKEARYEPFDQLHVEDDEWEKMKLSGEQYDDRIVEVHWDPSTSYWRLMRIRDDKPHANHKSVVENIIQSISDGVEREELVSRSTAIRNAWKLRQSRPPGTGSAPPMTRSTTSIAPVHRSPPSEAEWRYGPLASSKWSKVSGPLTIAGMNR